MREKMIRMSHYLNPFLERLSLLVKEACFPENPNQNTQPFINAAQPYLTVLEKALAQFTWNEKAIEYGEHFPSNESLRPLAFLIQILDEINPSQAIKISKDISKGKLVYQYNYALDYFSEVEYKTSLGTEDSIEKLIARYLRVQLQYNFLQINETCLQLTKRLMSHLSETPIHLMDLERLKSNIDNIYQIGNNIGLAKTEVFIDTPTECQTLGKTIKNLSYPATVDAVGERFKHGFYFSNNQYSLFPVAKNSSRSTPSTSVNPSPALTLFQ